MQILRTTSLVAGIALAVAASASAQISFKGKPNMLTWPSDCSTPVLFVNDTGVDLCDLWVSIENDEQHNHPEIARVTVQGPGSSWRVDDNEDGDDDEVDETDDLDESADLASHPPSTSAGWHRAQAHVLGDCVAPGATFTITLCNVQNGSLAPRLIALVGTTKDDQPLDHGGDEGYLIGDDPVRLDRSTPSHAVEVQSNPRPTPALPRFSCLLENLDSMPMPRVRIVPNDPDFDVIDVKADVPFTWSGGDTLNFTPPLLHGEKTQIWVQIDRFSNIGTTTDLTITAMGMPPVPYCQSKMNSQHCLPQIGGNGMPSVSSPQPFVIFCQQVINQKSGLLFYGYAPFSGPFQGGTMCVNTPLRRTLLQNSNGSPPPDNCSGFFAYDFNARIDSGVDASLVAGAQVFAQYWYRDPAVQSTTGLSNGLGFVIDL